MLFVNFAMLTKELFAGDVGRKLFQSQKKNFEAKKLFRFGREKVLRAGLNAVEAWRGLVCSIKGLMKVLWDLIRMFRILWCCRVRVPIIKLSISRFLLKLSMSAFGFNVFMSRWVNAKVSLTSF